MRPNFLHCGSLLVREIDPTDIDSGFLQATSLIPYTEEVADGTYPGPAILPQRR